MYTEALQQNIWIPIQPTKTQLNNEVHVWRANLDLSKNQLQKYKIVLSADERLKFESYRFNNDQNKYIASRGILRHILSLYLDDDPKNIVFTYNQYGKPFLKYNHNPKPLFFSVSHSGNIALYAITRNQKVGIDIQQFHKNIDCDLVGSKCYSDLEKKIKNSLPKQHKDHFFYTCWVRKEAFIKAKGTGLSEPLNGFSVLVDQKFPPRRISKTLRMNEINFWTIIDLFPEDKYYAAIAIEGIQTNLQYYQYKSSS